ncbi:hypothetical protein PIB30_000999 [Stylosanthes scabra]|uniref:Small ribosomal subunit protein mS38 n=1 Tax=Stylosanthes scabra TaxID=79078 RepID=A0ABU6T2A6_9FABA|nr:hypothetical protein [Stylosanthes scabra]
MASALQKILTRSLPNTKFLTPSLQRLSQVPPFKPSEPQTPSIQRPFPPIHPLPETESSGSSCSSVVFPSFPFGFFLDPTHPIIPPSPADSHGGDDDSGKLWADSVKKKRKRKMNKHKYKKLRKRMRRQS